MEEALDILRQIKMPKKQQNERSALVLLALLDMRPDGRWSAAKNPLCGITPMMEFFAEHYGKRYRPNSRETVRKHTIHQFLQAGLVVENPDRPDRPTNSGKTVYQISGDTRALLRRYGSASWKERLARYLVSHPGQDVRYRARDGRNAVSFMMSPGREISLSAGRHSELTEDICTEFARRFVKKCRIVYVGDTANKFAYIDEPALARLGIFLGKHGKIPDVIMYDPRRRWIFLVEAVTSHGPVDRKRRTELARVFSRATAGIVYVTAFPDRATLRKHTSDISWKTEVWVADDPDHMIHFDGERFLGPYE